LARRLYLGVNGLTAELSPGFARALRQEVSLGFLFYFSMDSIQALPSTHQSVEVKHPAMVTLIPFRLAFFIELNPHCYFRIVDLTPTPT
jgi:hypothetical protein